MIHKLQEIIDLCEREGMALHEYFLKTEAEESGETERKYQTYGAKSIGNGTPPFRY